MTLAIDNDQLLLAESVAAFANRHAPIGETRAALDELRRGAGFERVWKSVVAQGLHSIHLPTQFGGSDCDLTTLAVVIEQFGKALLPGPYLPTVAASAIAAVAGNESLLEAFGGGATGAVAAGEALRVYEDGDRWTITGISDPTVGLVGAEKILISVQDRSAPVWFWLDQPDTDDPTVAVHACDALDPTRSVGRIEFSGYRIPSGAVLAGIDTARADLITTALLAAEASGIAAWCLDTAVDHIKTRRQFDRPVGSFQAVQHKAALMLIRAEVASAAAWDAARAAGQPTDQQRLAAAHAALTALPGAVDQALDCITLLGGIGFSYEHDAQLYWRRAISICSQAGAEETWATRLGEAALSAERDFSFIDADTLPQLRSQIGVTLDAAAAMPDDDQPSAGWAPPRGGARRELLAEAGLTAPHYPHPYGLDAGPREQAVIRDEFLRRGLPQPELGIGGWALPTVLVHGTEAQKERFVAPTLRGKIIWCQLFSEPGAGSDLAGLTTRARRVAGGWRLTGQKVWNSQAVEADWGMCLARTDTDAPKHAGLTYFLVDMRSPGVTVRPLQQATGVWEFNEVFLDDAFVPDDCVIANPGDGWKLAVTTLSNERLAMGSAAFGHGAADLVRRLLDRGDHACSRGEAVRVLGRNAARELSVAALNLRAALAKMNGIDEGHHGAAGIRKAFHALAQRDSSRAVLSVLGPLGCVDTPEEPYANDYLGVPAVLIGGGTIEIQLNVIAQRVLGLPR
ncbi:acyl-CoA dehydrogenase family protein [Nocardia sp. NPDC051030]|uniref:acyl-CoA dehydrogenase family protein n=1 Tax=Nocardia sp. NPDC051030 TaxID=3155162 RepID=UPI00343B0410